MSKQNQNPGAVIGELLAAIMSGAKVEVERVEVGDDETIEQALERATKQRAGQPCPCMKCVARREAEAEVEAARKAGTDQSDTDQNDKATPPSVGKMLVGYMAFHEDREGTKPVFESFAKTYDEVEQARAKFLKEPTIQLLTMLMKERTPKIIIRPVYADL